MLKILSTATTVRQQICESVVNPDCSLGCEFNKKSILLHTIAI